MASKTRYTILLDSDTKDGWLESTERRSRFTARVMSFLIALILVQSCVIAARSVVIYSQIARAVSIYCEHTDSIRILQTRFFTLVCAHSTAPAQDILEYQVRKFNNGVNNTIYQGVPSPEVDRAWSDLYNGTRLCN